jgi:hypothetical protein
MYTLKVLSSLSISTPANVVAYRYSATAMGQKKALVDALAFRRSFCITGFMV